MASHKRSRVSDDDDGHRLAQRRRHTESTTFLDTLRANLRHGLASIRAWLDTAISEDPSSLAAPPVLTLACAEASRMTKELKRRFGIDTATMVFFGSNEGNQLGDPDMLVEDENDNEADTFVPPYLLRRVKGVRQVSAGGLHNIACDMDGQALTWGNPDDGILGRRLPDDGDVAGRLAATPLAVTGFVTRDGQQEDGTIVEVAAGNCHNVYRTLAGNVYSTGMYKDSDSGKFCIEAEAGASVQGSNDAPVHVPLPARAVRIFSGPDSDRAAALLENGRLYTWGMGDCGQLARTATMQAMPASGVYDLSRQWYVDDKGQVDETIVREKFMTPGEVIFEDGGKDKVILDVALGMKHTMVVARDKGQFASSVYVSGLNSEGQFGDGKSLDSKELAHEMTSHSLRKIQALGGKNIAQVAVGLEHSLALNLEGSELYAWGGSLVGQLGLGHKQGPLNSDKSVRTPTLVPFPEPVILDSIVCGGYSSMAITLDGDLYTWGTGEGFWINGHETKGKELIVWPTKLDLGASLADAEYKSASVMQASGGNMHSIVLIERFA